MSTDEILLERPQSEVLDQITSISSEFLEIFSLIGRKKKRGTNQAQYESGTKGVEQNQI